MSAHRVCAVCCLLSVLALSACRSPLSGVHKKAARPEPGPSTAVEGAGPAVTLDDDSGGRPGTRIPPASPERPPSPAEGEREGRPEYDFEDVEVAAELRRPADTVIDTGGVRDPRSGAKPDRPGPPGGSRPTPRRPKRPQGGGLKAGLADDNKQFNHFLDFLGRFSGQPHLALDVSSRLSIRLLDANGRSLPNCPVTFRSPGGAVLQVRRSYSNGEVLFFPSERPEHGVQGVEVLAECLGQERRQVLDPTGRRVVELKWDRPRPAVGRVPLDVAFLIDTTGSMGDEIARLKATLEAIHFQLAHLPSEPDLRFGMVLYRDRGDDYRTQLVPFTPDVDAFRRALDRVEAGGGGDGPEDLQEGLRRTLQDLKWRPEGIRLAFVLADAQPHLDYGQEFDYVRAMQSAARDAIKFVSIGASGLPPAGEIVFRQIAQYTQGLFVFLTYGETGESGGATSVSVSHHTGSNWVSRDLDAIVVQMVKREIGHLSDRAAGPDDEYYEVPPDAPQTDPSALLEELFAKGVGDLVKYSTFRLGERTPTAVLPVATAAPALAPVAEVIEDRLVLALAQVPWFQVVERRDAQSVLDELRRGGSDLFDPAQSARVGKLVGAQLGLISRVSRKKDRIEVFVKLVRVETGEVLAVTLLKGPHSLFQ